MTYYDQQFKDPIELSYGDKIKHIMKMENGAHYKPANVHVMRWNIPVNKRGPVYAVCLEAGEAEKAGGKIILFYDAEEAFKAADELCAWYGGLPMTTYAVERV